MILDIIAFTKFNFSSNTIRSFADNFKSFPITDLKDFLGDCPSGWEPLINEKWPRFIEGCDCTNVFSDIEIVREIHRNSCNLTETMAYCKDLPEQKALPFTVYRQKTLCKTRASENYFDFKNKKKISKEANCGFGMKLCGKLDTVGNLPLHKRKGSLSY